MKMTRINPPELFDSSGSGFSQIVIVEGDPRTIHVSGQVAWGAGRVIEGQGDLYAQVVQSLRNLETALSYAGASLGDVAALRIYIREDCMRQGTAVSQALREVFGDELPCATWIGVPCLASPDFLVEIEPAPVVVFVNS